MGGGRVEGAPRGGESERGGDKILRGAQRGAEGAVGSVWGTVRGQGCGGTRLGHRWGDGGAVRHTEGIIARGLGVWWDLSGAQRGDGGAVEHTQGTARCKGGSETHLRHSKGTGGR